MAQSSPDRDDTESAYNRLNGVRVGTPDGASCDMCNRPLSNGDDVLVHGMNGRKTVHITWVTCENHDVDETTDDSARFTARAELTTHVLNPSQLVLTNARPASTA